MRPWRPPHWLSSSLAALLVASSACTGVLLAGPVARALPGAGDLVQADAASSSVLAGGGAAAEAERADAVQDLLDARAAALLARDRTGWLTGVGAAGDDGGTTGGAAVLAGPSDGYAGRQAAVFDDIAEVPLDEWRWEYAGAGDPLPSARLLELGPAAWVARVVLVYRFEGSTEVRREQHLTIAPDTSGASGTATSATGAPEGASDGGGVRIVDDRDGPTAVDLWDLGPVRVARGERSLVLGTGDVSSYPSVVDEAAGRVDDVWGERWPRTTVVEVPRTQAELARLLGREDEAGLSQIAAVTTGETSAGEATTTGDRVVVNPDGFARLAALGRLVVLTHELTHVATRATTTEEVPIWLAEGFADWVGYRGTGLSRQTVAAPLLTSVRRGEVPAELPDADDFDPVRGDVSAAYAGSWLVVDMLAREHGERAVVDLYRAVAGVPPVEAAPAGGSDPSAPLVGGSGRGAATDDGTGTGADTPLGTAAGDGDEGADGSEDDSGGGDGGAQRARVDAALSSAVGTDLDGLRAEWQRYLVTVAG